MLMVSVSLLGVSTSISIAPAQAIVLNVRFVLNNL